MAQTVGTESLDPLLLDLIEWVVREPRTYRDVIETWRTSCPRLTIWEDAIDHGYLTREVKPALPVMVKVTEAGIALLREGGRQASADRVEMAVHAG
ncbi:MAG: hypothetical protein ACR2OV_02555 [Hyphomicrobiaceae bacterium]